MMFSDLELARESLRVYLPGATIEAGEDLAANVTDNGEEVVVALRGTANVQGWLRDLDTLPKSHPLIGYCHSGFLTGASQLLPRLTDVLLKDRRIVFTGHSLGGALALVLAALRVSSALPVQRVVTFGAPRAGYARLREVLAGTEVRQYRRGEDPVTEVPLTLLAFPYCHVREPLVKLGLIHWPVWVNHDVTGYIKDLETTQNSS